jgi:hypothetical protein
MLILSHLDCLIACSSGVVAFSLLVSRTINVVSTSLLTANIGLELGSFTTTS